MPTTRVVSIRLTTSEIVGCYEVLSSGDDSTVSGQPVASVVAHIIRELITHYREQNIIPSYTSEQTAEIRLMELVTDMKGIRDGTASKTTPLSRLPTYGKESIVTPEQQLKQIIKPFVEEAEKELEDDLMSDLKQDLQINKTKLAIPPWDGETRLPIHFILEEGIVTKHVHEYLSTRDLALEKAIEVAYNIVIPDEWYYKETTRKVEALRSFYQQWIDNNKDYFKT